MKQIKYTGWMLVLVILFGSCSKTYNVDDGSNSSDEPGVLSGEIKTYTKLTKDRTWTLKGYVYVTNSAILEIEAGTVIKSDTTQKGALIIERGAKLISNGTANQPIIFTSGKAAGQRAAGDWGGIIILGKATINQPGGEATIEGGIGRMYGGGANPNDNDNSGILRFMRIEFAGIAAQPNSEINGLTLGGVGRGTVIENIQVSYANDDAFEFFGGTVNCRNLVALATADDDFDFDFGYTGMIQFAVALRDPKFVDAGDAGNGIECDNENPYSGRTPFTRPVLSNFTLVGPSNTAGTAANHNFGNRWRRGTRFVFRNSVLLGNQKGGFSIESDASAGAYLRGESQFMNNIIYSVTAPFKISSVSADTLTVLQMEIKALNEGCLKLNSSQEMNLSNPFDLLNPDFRPNAGSPAMTGSLFTGDLSNSFFQSTNFRGAFGTTNWMAGWTYFDPKNGNY
ncbi:MAG TPA: hypothetical protein VI548_12180 [Chitinophagaceae bacterium]|nr:hypothetical protein [Chitinophagaceae bacterium]